jgi:O-antigen/teichoic acid export membrane protein
VLTDVHSSKNELASEPALTAIGMRNNLFAVVGRVLGVLSAFLVTATLAKLLPEGSFSDFQMLLTLLTPASWIAVCGFNSASVRLISEAEAVHGTAAAIAMTKSILMYSAISTLITMPVLFSALFLSMHYFHFPLTGEVQLLYLFVVAVAFIGLQQVIADCYYGHRAMGIAPLFTGGLMAGPVSTFLFLLLFVSWAAYSVTGNDANVYEFSWWGGTTLLHHSSVLEAMWVLVLALAISLPIAGVQLVRLVFREQLNTNIATANFRRLVSVSISLLGVALAAYLLTVLVDVLIAGSIFRNDAGQSLPELDLYFAARRLTFMAFIAIQLAGTLVAPHATRLFYKKQTAELSLILRRYAWYGGLLTIAGLLVLLLFPRELLSNFLHPRFADAASTVQILCIAPLFAAWAGHGGYALANTGHQKYCIYVNLLAALFVVIAGVPAAYQWQMHGLAVVSVLGFIIKHGAEWWLTYKLLGVWCHMR